MSQAQPGVLDRIFAKFQQRRQSTQQIHQEPAEIDDPANPGKKIKNPKFIGSTPQTTSDDPTSLFAGLFDQSDTKQAPKFNLSREKIAEAAGKMNFMDGMPKELQDALSSPEGMTFENISAAINHAGRAAYSKALEHGTSLTDHFVNTRITHEQGQLGEQIRTHMAKRRSVPAGMDNPVVKEHMELIAERIASKFPDATEDEIAEMSQEYFTSMAKAVNPKAFEQQQDTRGSGEPISEIQDYDSYLQGSKTLDQAKNTPAKAA